MKATLMHMDTPVVDVNINSGVISSANHIYHNELLPIGTQGKTDRLLADCLNRWQEMRSIPNDRQGIEKILSVLGKDPIYAYEIAKGLSLTDTYWIKPVNENMKWEDVNYKRNGFSDNFASVIIFDYNHAKVDFNSPDLTTDGCLEKAWVNSENGPILVKRGNFGINSGGKNLLSANEIVVSKIADLCGISHVEYFRVLNKQRDELMCGCPTFVKDDRTDFVNALQIIENGNAKFGKSLYDYFNNMGMKKEIDQMIVFDYLIRNTDRHEKNFGILVDAYDPKIVSFAPLFDNGSCLGWNQPYGENRYNDAKPFLYKFEEQLNLVSSIDLNIPEFNDVKKIIQEEYEAFNIPERQFQQACIEIRVGIMDLERKENELKKTIYIDEDLDR